jgi:hypothetical protein
VKRLISLLEPYTRHFGGDGFSHFTPATGDFGVAGIWTPTPWSLDRGYISPRSLARTRDFFTTLPPASLRILVQHQAALPRFNHRGISTCPWGSHRALGACDDLGVQLILSGHNHFHHAERASLPSGAHLIWVQCGTTTSNRFHGRGPARNSCNTITLSPGTLDVQPWHHDPTALAFLPGEMATFPL